MADIGNFRAIGCAALVLLGFADYLFWDLKAGLSLSVFAFAVIGVALVLVKSSLKDALIPMTIILVACLPSWVEVQFLSRVFYWAGFVLSGAFITLGGAKNMGALFAASQRFLCAGPLVIGTDAKAALALAKSRPNLRVSLAASALNWIMPLSVGAFFIGLFAIANPITEELLTKLDLAWVINWVNPNRIGFWILSIALVWPFLRITSLAPFVKTKIWAGCDPIVKSAQSNLIWNATSIRNALVLFNGMFFIQTAMDAGYLWGGVALPDGMSYASYAHRGAYPLVATALLAGVFALASRPFAQNGWMRLLLLGFLGQNLALVASSALRLDLYVDAYGLTYLRIWAAIWMGLVAFGLCTVIWQMSRGRTSVWLVQVNAALLAVVLYLACFVNWAGVIAAHNLDPRFEGQIDRTYLCGLPVGAYPVIRDWEKKTGQVIYPDSLRPNAPEIHDWREWDYRSARVLGYFRDEGVGQ